MTWMGYFMRLAALLIPFTACGQVGTVDHDWCIQSAGERYGAVQVTYPGPAATYTFIYFGKGEYHMHARAASLAEVILAPLALVALALVLSRVAAVEAAKKVPDPIRSADS